MKRLIVLVASLVLTATVAFAQGNERVRGVVLKFSAESNSVTVRTAPDAVRTLSLTDKTVFKKAGKTVELADLQVGDQVTLEVRPKTAQIIVMQIGGAAPPPTPK